MLLCLTANHQNASFELLEKLSVGAPTAANVLVGDGVTGAVVLATCNRIEAYLDLTADTVSEPVVEATIAALSRLSGVPQDGLTAALDVFSGGEVIEHLFAVASGLESVIVGEDEISGQVQRALARARAAGTTSSALEQLFQRASRTSRGVKNLTALGGAGRSLVRLALELASSRILDWTRTNVLIVGTGQYAGTTFAALQEHGVTDITVFSPSGRGAKFAIARGIPVADSLPAGLAAADVVITCTSSAEPIITPAQLAEGKPRLIVDLGVPRNVDPGVASVRNVELLDLQTINLHAPLQELHAADDARSIVSAAAAEYSAELTVAPAVVALRKHVFGILEAEIERARARGDADGTTEAALRHLAGVLLHAPSVRARELALEGAGQAFIDGLESIFGIASDLADAVHDDQDDHDESGLASAS